MSIGFTLSRFSLRFLFAASFLCYLGSCKNGNHTNTNLCNENDRQVLLKFRQGIDEDPYNVLSSWRTEQDCCKWMGVYCDSATGRVTRILLTSLFLEGDIDLSVLNLEFLNSLDLSFKNLSRIVPFHSTRNISHSKLTSLGLTSLNINPFPICDLGWISHLSSLEYLSLSGFDLHGETNWLQLLSSLPSLVDLYLSDCQLGKTFPSLGIGDVTNFTSLQFLDLSYNMFHGSIPSSIGNMSSLVSLDLSWNAFQGSIPSSIGSLSSLVSLNLESNSFNGSIPEGLWQSSKLQELTIGNNSFTGVVSDVNLSRLPNLTRLDMRYSSTLDFHFDSQWIPPFQLRDLELRSCKLGPEFPEWLYTQKSLAILDISGAGLSFTADDKFWIWLTEIDIIHLSDNSISGDMSNLMFTSEEIMIENNNFSGLLPSLTSRTNYFFAEGNSFSGPISRILCDTVFTDNLLLVLELSNNQLTGELPNCWMNWQALDYVNLGGNKITGKIPNSLGLLSKLRYLRLQNNRLYGEVPLALSNCKLIYLDLSGNRFLGNVTTWVKPNAFALILGSNQFSGDIPSQICLLSSLRILDLSHNNLSGQIPKCFNNITAMTSTSDSETSNSDFEQNFAILTWIWISDALKLVTKGQENNYKQNMIQFLRFIDLSSNHLSGTIPPEIFSVAALVFLNLSNNHLVGTIPKEIEQMGYLESLDLSRNQLSGGIPQSLSDLSFLAYLNLSYNNLSGCIPFGTQLQSFSPLSYMGNPELSGDPISKNCTVNNNSNFPPRSSSNEVEDDNDDFYSWFYFGLGVGFATSFCIVWSTLLFKRNWRQAYFSFMENLGDKIYVFVIRIKVNCWASS